MIAAKLNEIPVPDMSDAIWGGIEAQLDGMVQSPQKTRMPQFKGKGFFVSAGACITASVMIFYFVYRHPSKQAIPEKSVPAVQNTVTAIDTLVSTDSVKEVLSPTRPLKLNVDSSLLKGPPQHSAAGESTAAPTLSPEQPDSLHQEPSLPAPVIDSGYHFTPPTPVKKPKGVKGISNEDYKISTKRDTSVERP
ncbi:hypothetical protein CK934_13925 [Chitinophaga sp. MD30]|nr:hypothetical protein CK934_13925 [Chitinophaga sp. MD30]